MRESLTVLAGLVILILSAALVVPYFIDWNAERGLVERQLADVLGRPVKIRGAIDLKLLPMPYLRLANVELGAPAATPDVKAEDIKIQEVQLEIALTALLRGEVDFVEAKLVRPRFALAIENGTLPLGPPIRHFSGPMRFERISVEDGALRLADPATGRTYAFDNISFGAEASSLSGPFKAEGRLSFAGVPSSFRLATGASRADRLHFKLVVDENRAHPRADVDADLIFAKSAAGLPSLAGEIKLSGHLTGDIALPWQLSGKATGDLRKAALDEIDLRLGDDEHGVSFSGAAQFEFGRSPRAHAMLKARDINLDKLLAEKGGRPAMQRLAQTLGDLAKSKEVAIADMALTLEASADSAILGGETLSGLSGAVSVSAKTAIGLRFDAAGPGHSHLRLLGEVETGDAAGFKGHVEASAGDVPRLTHWLSANLPQTASLLAQLSLTSFDVSGQANLSAVGFVGQNLSLRLDQSQLAGTLAYTQSVAGEPGRLFADLSAARLDLSHVPDLSSLASRAAGLDLSLRFDAQAVKIASFGQGRLDTGRIRLRLEKTGKRAKLDEFAVTGVGGADIHAHGQWDNGAGDFTGAIDSNRLDALAALLHRLAPSPLSAFFLARAGDLAPAHLTLSAHAATDPHGAVTLENFDLSGSAGGTRIAAKMTGKIGTDRRNLSDLDLSAKLDAPDALALIRQLGLPALPLRGLGPGQIEITALGRADTSFATKLDASLPGTQLAFDGSVKLDQAVPHATGALQLKSADLTSLFEATGLAYPDPAMRLAADLKGSVEARPGNLVLSALSGAFAGARIKGDLTYDAAKNHLSGGLDVDRLSFAGLAELALGAMAPADQGAIWSSAKFAPAMLDPPPVDLALKAKTFDLWPQMSGRDASLDMHISGGRAGLAMTLQHVAMKLGAGNLAGNVTLRRDGANAAASGHLNLADYDLVLPSLRGQISADLDIAGTGDNPAAIIAGLAGAGTLSFADLILPRTDPGSMLRVFKAVEDDTLALDADEINRALVAEFDKGAAHLGTVSFDAGLAAGLLRLTPKEAEPKRLDPGVTETLQGSVDLNRLTLDQRSRLSLVALPKNWNGPPPVISLISRGPLANPVRTIESVTFINALAARAIARESARIQAQEFDLHEQTFFYNRLKSERRREQERSKAAEDAAKAEQAKAEDEKLKTGQVKAEGDKPKAESQPAAVPLPVARPMFGPFPRAPLPIVRQPAQRPASPAPFFQSPMASPDPLAAGPF